MQAYAVEAPFDRHAVLVVDATGFVKKESTPSAWCGSTRVRMDELRTVRSAFS